MVYVCRLAVLMAKAGLYIPAQEARLPWFDNVRKQKEQNETRLSETKAD
jgi:dsDNA-specific endonuclease/ATPase MutS2